MESVTPVGAAVCGALAVVPSATSKAVTASGSTFLDAPALQKQSTNSAVQTPVMTETDTVSCTILST